MDNNIKDLFHDFITATDINPKGIVPLGPELKFDEPHNRDNK
ncbi:MAG: hypothetical protein Q8L78_02400 [Coxiellaceae bacterium]|nr:hypothetical protein [Coxiellaceae bacterium]